MDGMKGINGAVTGAPHTMVVEDRKRLSVSGVTDVESFDEETVALATELGELLIHGYDLHINRIDVERIFVLVECIPIFNASFHFQLLKSKIIKGNNIKMIEDMR